MKKSEQKGLNSYEVNVTRAKEIKEGTVAFDMEVNGVNIYGCFYREYKTKDGKDGTLISFPSEKGKDKKGNEAYFNKAFFPISNELKENIVKQLEALV